MKPSARAMPVGAVTPVVAGAVGFPVLVVFFLVLVLIRPRRVGVVEVIPVLGAVALRITDAQFRPQTIEVRPAAAVLQLAGDLGLLGLGPAAPHWLDPLNDGAPRPRVSTHDQR